MAKDRKNIGNKRPENHEEYTKLVGGGIGADSNYEIGGVVNQDKYLRGKNLRVTSKKNSLGVERIDGEQLLYDYQPNPGADKYICILATDINSHIITIWASTEWSEEVHTDGIMCIDDVIMLQSDKFPVRHIHIMDSDKNENCLGGELYVTDNNLPPMYFNIQDIIDNYNSGSQKYFDLFDYKDYTVNLRLPINMLMFDGIKDIGSGGGLPTGLYSYSYRLKSDSGDATNWSMSTPQIIVPNNYIQDGDTINFFKYQDTKGSDSNNEYGTIYAIVLRLRIDNRYGYDYVEIKRVSYNNNEGLGYIPEARIVQRIPIEKNQFSILEIIDGNATQTDNVAVSSDDLTNSSAIIRRAEAIRYFKNKIILANIEYEDRKVEEIDFEYKLSPESELKMNPILRYLGEEGYKNIYNNSYIKSFMNDEKYGFSIIFWDDNFERTFVVPIEDFKNYKFPSKRQSITGDSLSRKELDNMYHYGSPYIKTELIDDSFEISETFNNVLNTSLTKYSDYPPSPGDEYEDEGLSWAFGKSSGLHPTSFVANITKNSFAPPWGSVDANNVGLRLRNPTSDSDLENRRIYGGSSMVGSRESGGYINISLKPNGTYSHYYALGISLEGISNIPDWVKAFSIARTKPAGFVVSQGLAVYNMPKISVFNTEPDFRDKKSLNKIDCFFTDIKSGVLSSKEVENILNNPSQYKIQVVEALGFFSEVYNSSPIWTNPDDTNPIVDEGFAVSSELDKMTYPTNADVIPSEKNDIVVYAYIQNEDVMKDQNGADSGVQSGASCPFPSGIGSNQVSMGYFRNPTTPTPTEILSSTLYEIKQIRINTDNAEGVEYFEIELERDIYVTEEYRPGSYDKAAWFNRDETKKFHEPVYIVNIIKTGANVTDSSIKEYISPSNLIKVESLVGISDGSPLQEYEIVDERIEDFYSFETLKQDYGLDSFIYIDKNNGDERKRYINVTHSTPAELLVILDDIANQTTVYCGSLLYGTYTATKTKITIDELYSQNQPEAGDFIYVMYDNNKPISVFGGDTVSDKVLFAQYHRECSTQGFYSEPVYDKQKGTQVEQLIGYPWNHIRYPITIYKHQAKSGYNHIQIEREFTIYAIRQLVWMFISQSRANISFCYGEFYPNIGYVERPNLWNETLTEGENNVNDFYPTRYPNEKERWKLGGIRINQFPFNLDYSKIAEHDKFYYIKKFLSEDQLRYCTRIVWSQTRQVQSSDAPNLKTFRLLNYKDIADKFGDIRKLFISSDRYGDNLYAFCEQDIALLLVSKRTLSDASGNVIGTTGNSDSAFIAQEEWQNIGEKNALQKLHKWTWAEDGNNAYYANKNGVFVFSEGNVKVTDITEGNRDLLNKNIQEAFGTLFLNTDDSGKSIVELECLGYGFFDNKFSEYGFITKRPSVIVNDITKEEESDTNLNYYDVSQSNNILFEYIYDDEVTSYRTLKIVNKSLALPGEEKTFYIRKTVNQELILKIYEDSTSTTTYITLPAEVKYFKLERLITPIDIYENFGEWVAEEINKDLLESSQNLFVYCSRETIKAWVSENEYRFDKVITVDGKRYGFRNLKTYALEKGDILNGENINFELTDSANPTKEALEQEKEFVRLQVNTAKDITKENLQVDFLKPDEETLFSSINGTNTKKYGGYTNYIPRGFETGQRYQDNKVIFRIKYNGKEKIAITSVDIQYKILK